MLRRLLAVLAFCLATMGIGIVSAQDRKAAKLSDTQSSRLVEPTTIQQMQLATLGKYSGKLVASPLANKTRAKRQSTDPETLKDEMSNSFIISGGYLYQRVDDLPVHRVQGISASAFYYPIPWVGVGGEYQYGRGTANATSGSVSRQDKLTRHVAVFGPEFSAYPGDSVRLFIHPLFGWAKERMTTRTGTATTTATTTTEDTNLAVNVGAGLDIRLSRTFLLRPIQVDYLGIRRNSHFQNNWRVASGIAIRPH